MIEHEKRKDNEKRKAEKAEMKSVKSKAATLPTRRSARNVCSKSVYDILRHEKTSLSNIQISSFQFENKDENTDKVNPQKMQPTIVVSPTNSVVEDSPLSPSSSRLDKPADDKRKGAPLRSETLKV